jgi:flagellar biosynthetic protein FlhB
MASSGEDKTEQATPKRRAEARNRGRVARSQDLNTAAALLAGLVALAVEGPHIVQSLEATLTHGLSQSGDTDLVSQDGLGSLTMWGIRSFASAVAPVVIAAAAGGVLANVAQVRLKFSTKALQPSFGKLNPASGLKRLFGTSGLIETCKALGKLTVIGGIAFMVVWPKLDTFGQLTGLPPGLLLSQLGGEVVSIVMPVGGALGVLAAADYWYQRKKLSKSLKMSKSEVKQEARQADLAPEVRGAIRRRQMQTARRRMMAEIPSADVVVVNPTHYAAALRYDGSKPAPELVAKGADHVAFAMRELAKEHGVPIVSNPPLARTLYAKVEVGAQVPEELFTAVAEVLAYVFRVAGRRRLGRRRAA